jgi:triosephosphate isomerase
MSNNKIIVGNWKMNCLKKDGGNLATQIRQSAKNSANVIVVCPPFTIVSEIATILADSNIDIGAQDCHYEEKGAFTGNISPAMLVDSGAKYVILGHSERRAYHAESSDLVRKKSLAAIKGNLIPIICVGESLAERESGQAKQVVEKQLVESLPENSSNFIIAYEPVWAIGTGKVASSGDILEMHNFIASLPICAGKPILYGGSVNDANSVEILAINNVSGLLIGGASIVAEKFLKIIDNLVGG